jgi:ligand-binding SRPBCC domain-containing protein
MREIERSRFVPSTPRELEGLLDPARIVELEGSFSVEATIESDEGTLVTVSGPGLTFTLRFEPIDRGFYYTQAGEAGPFESMETWLTAAPENEGSRVSVRSSVSIAVPLPFSDRLAAWKRRGELDRLLDRIAAEA